MCMKCTVGSFLEQLRWELVIQVDELSGNKTSDDVIETAKNRVKENGTTLLPVLQLSKPKEMGEQEYHEAEQIFRESMLIGRKRQIEAIEILGDLFEMEIFPDKKTLLVDAGIILNGGYNEEEQQEI